MKMIIEINRLRVHAHHGVMEQERRVGNEFEISVSVSYPVTVGSDDLSATLNYAAAIDLVKDVMAQPSALLEHVAFRLREALVGEWPLIDGGRIKVAKLTPPLSAEVSEVAAVLEW